MKQSMKPSTNEDFKRAISCACNDASKRGSSDDYGKLMRIKRAYLKNEDGACLSDEELEWLVNMAKRGGWKRAARGEPCTA